MTIDAAAEDGSVGEPEPQVTTAAVAIAPAPDLAPGARPFPADGEPRPDAPAIEGVARAEAERRAAVEQERAAASERRAIWDRLADCESGDWVEGVPQPDTRTWDYGLAAGENGYFEGGLQFDPRTWDGFRDPDMPSHAGAATPEQQIAVAERVLDRQGWRAWPVCSKKLGYR